MAEQVVAAVLQRVGATVIREATSLRDVPAKVETLTSELQRMQCFLRDTDARMERGEMVKNLVSEVRDVAYSIEIIIDKANILVRENERKRSFMGAISKGAHYPFHCMHLYNIGKRIDRVTARVHAIFKEFTKYSIVSIHLNETRYSMDENESSRAKGLILPDFEDEVDVIGFGSEIGQIKDELLDSENKDLTVISLVGPGGAGKSTFARKVYNLVVLDDVWRMEDWDMIQAAFPDRKNGSRIVVTTRNSAVSNHPNTRKIIHEVKLLNNEESIELFNRKAFPPYVVHDRNDQDSFRELGKAQCNGLPLAIVILGGFLSKNLSILSGKEWLLA